MSSKTLFQFTLLATLLVKLVLAVIVPLSGDEAYFLVWARHPDLGFYDHPPMVGWFLQLMLHFGNSPWVLRLPAILTGTLIGLGVFRLLKPFDETKAAFAAVLYLVAPLNVINVLITTDTPLILFSFLSAWALFAAHQRNGLAWYALSGALLGMAFLSKYFAVLLIFGYLVYFALTWREQRNIAGIVLLFLSALPFAAINLYWNYTHCWDNILFNLYTRNEGEELSIGKVGIFAGMMLYLLTPPALYYLFRHRAGFGQRMTGNPVKLFVYVFAVPMLLFGLLSLKKVIGLHWVFSFYAFFFVMLAMFLSREELLKTVKFMALLTAAHLAAIAVIAWLPMETWKNHKLYDGIVFMFRNNEVVEHIRPYETRFLLASDGYTPAAILSYHYGREFFVFGEGSSFARQDDIVTDFRPFAGRDILVVTKSAPDMEKYAPYFRSTEVKSFELHEVPFYLMLGYGFDFAKYREQVLRPAMEKYYSIPDWLPHAPCYFCERYFPGEKN